MRSDVKRSMAALNNQPPDKKEIVSVRFFGQLKEDFIMMYGLTPFERRSLGLFDAMHELEKDFFGDTWAGTNLRSRSFSTDIKDEGDKYVLEAELPGFAKEDISIDITGDTLTLSAERGSETNEDEGKNYIRRERVYGSYRRSFNISGVDSDAVGAEYKDGVLTVSMPKKEPKAPSSRRLEIKG